MSECDTCPKYEAKVLQRIECIEEDNAALRKENEELRKDKQRIDWLALNCYFPYDAPQAGIYAVVCSDAAPNGAFGDFGEGDKRAFRLAIDLFFLGRDSTKSEASHVA